MFPIDHVLTHMKRHFEAKQFLGVFMIICMDVRYEIPCILIVD